MTTNSTTNADTGLLDDIKEYVWLQTDRRRAKKLATEAPTSVERVSQQLIAAQALAELKELTPSIHKRVRELAGEFTGTAEVTVGRWVVVIDHEYLQEVRDV